MKKHVFTIAATITCLIQASEYEHKLTSILETYTPLPAVITKLIVAYNALYQKTFQEKLSSVQLYTTLSRTIQAMVLQRISNKHLLQNIACYNLETMSIAFPIGKREVSRATISPYGNFLAYTEPFSEGPTSSDTTHLVTFNQPKKFPWSTGINALKVWKNSGHIVIFSPQEDYCLLTQPFGRTITLVTLPSCQEKPIRIVFGNIATIPPSGNEILAQYQPNQDPPTISSLLFLPHRKNGEFTQKTVWHSDHLNSQAAFSESGRFVVSISSKTNKITILNSQTGTHYYSLQSPIFNLPKNISKISLSDEEETQKMYYSWRHEMIPQGKDTRFEITEIIFHTQSNTAKQSIIGQGTIQTRHKIFDLHSGYLAYITHDQKTKTNDLIIEKHHTDAR